MRRLKGEEVKGQGRNPESLPCPKLHGLRAEPPSASARGGAQPVEVGDFLLRRRVGGFLRCSKEGVRRVRRSVRKLQIIANLRGRADPSCGRGPGAPAELGGQQ